MNTPASRADRVAALPERLREALAQRLAGRGAPAAATAAPLVPAVARDGDLRPSYGQQRLWFLDDFAPGGADYHSALPVRISGPSTRTRCAPPSATWWPVTRRCGRPSPRATAGACNASTTGSTRTG